MGQPSRLIDFGALPRDPDRDASLVEVRRAERTRDEIVLAESLQRKVERIEAEHRGRAALSRHGLVPKSRLLFVGPPGCGKTLCAEVLANDLGLAIIYARFDGILSSFLGETASNLRRLFNYARQQQAVLFFDEFDAIGKGRDDPHEVGELKRIVGSFLQLLDSHPREHMVVAATNNEALLDGALWRRFDDVLFFGKPTADQLTRLVELRLRGVRKRDIDVAELAQKMKGFTFADAERVCLDASKAMIMAGRKEMTVALLDDELREQRARIRLASGRRRSRP